MRSASSYPQSALATSSTLVWTFVGVLSVTYGLSAWGLAVLEPVRPEVWERFNEQVPAEVFTWQVAAFGGVLLLNIINLMFCSAPVQYNCNLLLGLIHAIAFATDWMLAANATPVVVSWSGRMFLPLRYVQWCHTTPTMIVLMAMMSSMEGRDLAAAVAADIVMIVTGLIATWTSGTTQLLSLLVSMLAFCGVLAAVWSMFRDALREAGSDPPLKVLMERLLGLTLIVWSLFPAVWMAAWGGLVSLGMEQLLWGATDYAAKVVFSSHLWQKNLATLQQRREATQELMGALDRGVLLDRLRSLRSSRERLVHAMQHELTTPMQGVLALVQELVHNKTQSAASRTKMLMMIRSSAACVLNTISATLAATTMDNEYSEQQRRLHKVHLWRVAESVLRLMRPMVRDNVKLLNCISKDMPPVKGDSIRLMQVLMNLVSSSLKLTPTGAIKISASQTHSLAQVVVADTGQGINSQQLQQALDPFETVDGVGGSSPPELWDVCRAGLGLYLVKQALSSMGSRLEASSEVGVGSSFGFELPLADSECDSESEVEELFSETGSVRASLDLTELDSRLFKPAGSGSGSGSGSGLPNENVQSRRMSLDKQGPPALQLTAAAADGSSTAAAAVTTAAAAAVVVNASSTPVGGVSNGGSGGSVNNNSGSGQAPDGPQVALPSVGSPLKSNHRVVHNGVIQVLSVDDDAVNQLVAAATMRSSKWEVVKCMSGAEAVEYLLHRCSVLPDLVLLDVMMPTMNGYEVAAKIRQAYPSSLLPIIMVSAKTEEEDIVQGLRCGADDYVPKPFKRAELCARIRAHIRARDAFQQQQASEQQWMLQHNLLPLNVQRKLRNGETVIAESHPAATVLWAEVLGATAAPAHTQLNNTPTAAAAAAGAAQQQQQQPIQVPVPMARSSSRQQLLLAAAAAAGADPAAVAAAAAAGANSSGVDAGGGGGEASSSLSGSLLRDSSAASLLAAAAGGGGGSSSVNSVNGGVGGVFGLSPLPPGLSPAEAVVCLNSLYTTWEELCQQKNVLSVDFSGSTFVAVSGHDDNPQHRSLIMRAAHAMLAVAAATTLPDGRPLAVRLGVHTGPLTTGLVGSKAVKLVLMGDTVEGARHLAASACPGAIHISSDVAATLAPAAAASALPWTHQRLPGAISSQQTYLLHTQEGGTAKTGGTTAGPAAAAVGLNQQQQQDQAAADGLEAAGGVRLQPKQPCSSTVEQLNDAAAATTFKIDGVAAAAGGAVALQPAHDSSVQQQCQLAQQQQQQPSTDEVPPATVVVSALPPPAPTSSTRFNTGSAAQGVGVGVGGSSRRKSVDLPRSVAGTGPGGASRAAAAAAVSVGAGHVAGSVAAGVDESAADDEAWLLSATAPAAPAAVTSISTSNDSSTPAAPPPPQAPVAAAAASSTSGSLSSSSKSSSSLPSLPGSALPRVAVATAVSSLAVTPTPPQAAAAAAAAAAAGGGDAPVTPSSSLALPQAAAAGSVLLSQLTVERRHLQDQLLERTAQWSAASTELQCVRDQLQESRAAAEQQGRLVEALRQQLAQVWVRAQLADAWQALAAMRGQINTLAAVPQPPQQ